MEAHMTVYGHLFQRQHHTDTRKNKNFVVKLLKGAKLQLPLE
jgi:hypothetical protein